MTEPAIRADNLGKCYQVSQAARKMNGVRRYRYHNTLRDTLVNLASAPLRRWRNRGLSGRVEPFWALKEVSFDIEGGEVVGIIGRNGAGKSTLLKILSRITKPTEGQARFRGRVGSLLEVGTGFHPELTGRENIYLNGGLLGMSRREISHNFDNIVAFAEIERFLDTPVKRYSSGMYVRLAFAVAAHLRPEIMIVDEVLAVGDMAFQKKCLGKMGEVSRSGRTVILVSHNIATILNLCKRVIVLDKGRLAFSGSCEDGVAHYMKVYDQGHGARIDFAGHPGRTSGSKPIIQQLCLRNRTGQATDQILCGEPMTIELLLETESEIQDFDIEIHVQDSFGVPLFVVGSEFSTSAISSLRGRQRLVCHLDQVPLLAGRYCLSLYAGIHKVANLDVVEQAAWFNILETDFFGTGRLPSSNQGHFLVRSTWEATSVMEEGRDLSA